MVLMMNNLNRTSFAGERKVTCFTCHNGNRHPRQGANLKIQYRDPDDDPNEIQVPPEGFPDAPTPDAVFTKYIQAVGGAQRVGAITNFVAKGTYSGFDTEHMKLPVEIYSKAPNQRTQILHALFGQKINVFNGTAGWFSTADKPVPLIPLTGGNLDGARIDAHARRENFAAALHAHSRKTARQVLDCPRLGFAHRLHVGRYHLVFTF